MRLLELILFIVYVAGAILAVVLGILYWMVRLIPTLLKTLIGFLRAYITCLPESYRRKIKMYDTYGLKHNAGYINSPRVRNQVAVMPVKGQCEYADMITTSGFPKNPKRKKHTFDLFSHPIFKKNMPVNWRLFETPVNISAINTTAIGNMAWISQFHPDHETRNKATELLADIREYYLGIITSNQYQGL